MTNLTKKCKCGYQFVISSDIDENAYVVVADREYRRLLQLEALIKSLGGFDMLLEEQCSENLSSAVFELTSMISSLRICPACSRLILEDLNTPGSCQVYMPETQESHEGK